MKNKRPVFKLYATFEEGVDLDNAKETLKKKYAAFRITQLEGEDMSSLIFTGRMQQLNNIWTFLKKKRGVKKIWLGLT